MGSFGGLSNNGDGSATLTSYSFLNRLFKNYPVLYEGYVE